MSPDALHHGQSDLRGGTTRLEEADENRTVLESVLEQGRLAVQLARGETRSLIAFLWLIAAVLYALDPVSFWKIQATYVLLFIFQVTILAVLLRYIFSAQAVTRDVLYAAVTVYILLAAAFVPVYGFLEGVSPGAFLDNATGQPVFWQQLIKLP